MKQLRQLRNKRLRLLAELLLVLVAALAAMPMGIQAVGGTLMLGLGVTLLPECVGTGTYACNPCDPIESGRVSGIGFSLVPLTDMTSQAEWAAKVLDGTAIIIPAVNGEYSATPTKSPGMGRTEEQTTGLKHTIKFDLFKRGATNTALFDKLNYNASYYLYWVTDTLIYYAGTTVNSATTFKIEKTIDTKVMYVSEIVWNYPLNPSDDTKPAVIFDQCVDFGDGEELGDGFGFSANPGRASAVDFVSGSAYDITVPLNIVNSSVPAAQTTFNLSASGWPAGFTLQTASIPNTGVGPVSGSAVIRVDTAVATGWRDVLQDALPLTIDAGAYGTEVYDDLWFPCDLMLVIDGSKLLVTTPVDDLTYVSGGAGSASDLLDVSRSCYEAVSRTVQFGPDNTLPNTEAVNVGGVIVTGVAQAINVNATGVPIIVSDGGAATGTYTLHLVIAEVGTDTSGFAANPIRSIRIPVVIT